MSQFILKIDLGNDAMRTDQDIAIMLREIANRVEFDGITFRAGTLRGHCDRNGNTVGHYEVSE